MGGEELMENGRVVDEGPLPLLNDLVVVADARPDGFVEGEAEWEPVDELVVDADLELLKLSVEDGL